MRISGSLPPMRAVRTGGSKPDRAATGGSAKIDERRPGAGAVAGPSVAHIETIVAVAAGEDGRERRRRMAEHCETGIDLLEALHAQLVAGRSGRASLSALADWASAAQRPDDAILAALHREIELRALVEMAKQDVRPAGA